MTAIIDYGAGNIRSVEKAFSYLGFPAICTDDPKEILNSERVILPGDGSFGYAMDSLKNTNLIPVIKEVVCRNIPFLGICLGYQLLFDGSEEDGGVEGLSIFSGDCKRFPESLDIRVPQIGWNNLNIKKDDKVYKGLSGDVYVYFVHSYYVKCKDTSIVASTTEYGLEYDSSIQVGNAFGMQFHPEKSSSLGIEMLRNFCKCTQKE